MRVRVPKVTPRGDHKALAASHTHPVPSGKTTVPAGHGHAFLVDPSSRFRITDLYGTQVVDLTSHLPTLEKMSMAYTRYHLRGVTPNVGEHLYSNADRKLLRVVEDTVKVHDMTYMACFPSMYNKSGAGHRSCSHNVLEAMNKFGMRNILEVPEPFNCFQNTMNYSLKAMGSSRAGDYVEFEAEEGLVVCMSCCPYDVDGFNGGEVTDVEVEVWQEDEVRV